MSETTRFERLLQQATLAQIRGSLAVAGKILEAGIPNELQQAEYDKKQRWTEAILKEIHNANKNPFAQMMAAAWQRRIEQEAEGIFEGDFKLVSKVTE